MTVTDENSVSEKEVENVKSSEKRDLYGAVSKLGEYFTNVFVTSMKFLGFCFMYFIATIYRWLTYLKEPFGKFVHNIAEAVTSPFKRHAKARKLGSAEIAAARREKGAWGAFKARVRVMGRAVLGKRGLLATAVNWGLPIVSCVFLVNIVSYANSQNYALKLTVNGDFVGYIDDETAFIDAEKMVQNRINYTGSTTEVITFEPSYEIESIGSGSLLNQYQIADKMLALLGKEIKEGYGLYLGNSYYGTMTSHDKLDRAMQGVLDRYSTGEEKETVQFDKQINYISGMYLADSFVDEDEIIEQFTSNKKEAVYYTVKEGEGLSSVLEASGLTEEELAALNPELESDHVFEAGEQIKIAAEEPFLTVMVTRELHYTESFEYETEYVDDDTLYAGNTRIKVPGEYGERAVVANVSYINGVEINRRILSRQVTKEPVTEVIAVGTKPRTNTTAPGQTIGYGLMLWPVSDVPGVHYGAGYAGHTGVDIMAPYGTPIYAAENGIVTEMAFDNGYHGGRGNHVVIKGDSGYTTYYYHASSVVAYVGQRVTAGDLIAYVGQTGEAWGDHLHFGVSIGGVYQNPKNYLPPHQ